MDLISLLIQYHKTKEQLQHCTKTIVYFFSKLICLNMYEICIKYISLPLLITNLIHHTFLSPSL